MQEEDTIIPSKPFDVEQFQAFLTSLPEESHPITRPTLNVGEDNIRDAIQRESFWRAQPETEHRNEELAHALFAQGKIDEALSLAKNPERRAYYESIGMAMLKDDNTFCECPAIEEVLTTNMQTDGEVEIKPHYDQLWHQVGQYPSAKHGGKLTPIWKCAKCGDVNITNEG